MILVDANLLLYAYDPDSVQHDASRRWLEDQLSGGELVRFATWLTLWAFMRISTNARIFARPLTAPEAHEAVGAWLQQPNAGVIDLEDRHQEILGRLLARGQASGALVMDAALAAIAIEHGAKLSVRPTATSSGSMGSTGTIRSRPESHLQASRRVYGPGRPADFVLTPRKLLFHCLLHETRHWAQIALAPRRAGLEPPGNHDLFFSKALR